MSWILLLAWLSKDYVHGGCLRSARGPASIPDLLSSGSFTHGSIVLEMVDPALFGPFPAAFSAVPARQGTTATRAGMAGIPRSAFGAPAPVCAPPPGRPHADVHFRSDGDHTESNPPCLRLRSGQLQQRHRGGRW